MHFATIPWLVLGGGGHASKFVFSPEPRRRGGIAGATLLFVLGATLFFVLGAIAATALYPHADANRRSESAGVSDRAVPASTFGAISPQSATLSPHRRRGNENQPYYWSAQGYKSPWALEINLIGAANLYGATSQNYVPFAAGELRVRSAEQYRSRLLNWRFDRSLSCWGHNYNLYADQRLMTQSAGFWK
jgi:hypothetical protein